MSKIDELIKEYCPNGVEKVKLVSVASVLYGCPFDAKLFTGDDSFMPLIRIRDILPGIPSTYYMGDYEDTYIIHKGDILVGMDGNFNLARWNSRDGVLCQRSCKIESSDSKKVLNNYLFHYLGPIFKKIEEETPGGSVKHLSAKAINNIEIPLPPLPIQEEIVRILDKFTAIQENLDEELKLRQKQYEHYREKLLTFEDGDCEFIGMKELFDSRNGYTPSTSNKEFWENGEYPWFKMEDIRENGHILSDSSNHITKRAIKGKGLFKSNSIILATSATIGEHALILVPHLSNQRFTNYYPQKKYEDLLYSKYIYHYFYEIDKWCKEHTIQGNFAGVNMTELSNYLFPVPSLSRQQEIIAILDKFEAMIANIKEEQKLRQKQYEYYREKLLSF